MRKHTCRHMGPAKTQIRLCIRAVWSVFDVCIKKLCSLGYPKYAQWRVWSDCANAQADLNLCWVQMSVRMSSDIAANIYQLTRQYPARSGLKSKVDSARFILTIIKLTAHAILIINTQPQQTHICKPHKSPVAMGKRRNSSWGNTGSCRCGPAHRWPDVFFTLLLHWS